MEKENEKKLLHFDETAYNKAVDKLNEMQEASQYLVDCYRLQPLFEKQKISDEVFKAIMKAGAKYMVQEMMTMIKNSYDSRIPGLSRQVEIQQPNLVSVDVGRMDRMQTVLKSTGNVKSSLLTIKNDKVIISAETLKNLKLKFCVFDTNQEVRGIFEIGELGSAVLNQLQKIIDDKAVAQEKATGLRPVQTLKIFPTKPPEGVHVQPGEAGKNGCFYQDDKTNNWIFNIKKFV